MACFTSGTKGAHINSYSMLDLDMRMDKQEVVNDYLRADVRSCASARSMSWQGASVLMKS